MLWLTQRRTAPSLLLVLVTLTAAVGLAVSAFAAPLARPAEANRPIRWAYHVNFDSATGLASLRAHAQRLTHLSPRWYLLDANGALAPAPDPNRAEIIALARASGVKLTPYVRNTAKWNDLTPLLASDTARAAAVAAITGAVVSENFDGIHLDFEEINPDDRDRLTRFVGELAAALHERGKIVSQAVGPKTADVSTGWGASWDYAGLGKVNDYLVVMAYTAPATRPHPIGGAAFTESNISYALSNVPAEKVILGIPWYGYDWNTTAGTAGEVLTGPQALERARQHGATPEWDAAEQEFTYEYRRSGERHRVWYAEQRSQDVRIGLAAKFGLAGVAFWRLGQEEPDVWTSLLAEVAEPSRPVAASPTEARSGSLAPDEHHPETDAIVESPTLLWMNIIVLPLAAALAMVAGLVVRRRRWLRR